MANGKGIVRWEQDGPIAPHRHRQPSAQKRSEPGDGESLRCRVAAVNQLAAVFAPVVVCGEGGAHSPAGATSKCSTACAGNRPRECTSRGDESSFYAGYLSVLDLNAPSICPAIRWRRHRRSAMPRLRFCDLRSIVADDAKLAFNFVRLGLHPGMGATFLAPHRLGPERANDLCFFPAAASTA